MDLLNVLIRTESLENVDKIFRYVISDDVYIKYVYIQYFHIKIKHSLNAKQYGKRIPVLKFQYIFLSGDGGKNN